MEQAYWMEGDVKIPEEKRGELNEYVLKILKLGGIRKQKELEIGGRQVTVVQKPEPDREGKVWFDYSVFEQKRRKASYYDRNSCTLYAPDSGSAEFGLVMNLVRTMQEAYSEGDCYLMCGDQVSDVTGYAWLTEQLTGLKLSFPKRGQVWDLLVYFKSAGKFGDAIDRSIWDNIPYGYVEPDLEQLLACMICPYYSEDQSEEISCGGKSEIKLLKTMQRVDYVYGLFQELIEKKGEEAVNSFLKQLLDQDFAGRESLAEGEDEFACIAEVSLYELPAYIVAAYGQAVHKKFWDAWFSLGITGYKDIHRQRLNEDGVGRKQEEDVQLTFYRAILRENEDEFLEYAEEDGMVLSDGMKESMEEWKRLYNEADEAKAAAIQTETYLGELLAELQDIWKIRFVDEDFVNEFLGHPDDIRYKKALFIFRQIEDGALECFTDPVARQVKEWVVRRYSRREERDRLGAYASLLINAKRRFCLFGF